MGKKKENVPRWEAEWQEESLRDEKQRERDGGVEKGTRGMAREREREGRGGSSYVVWEVKHQPTLFTSQMLNVSFC